MALTLHNRWVMFAFLTLAYSYTGFQYSSTLELDVIVNNVLREEQNLTYEEGCPFLYADSYWSSRKSLQLTLPTYYWKQNMKRIAGSVFLLGSTTTAVPAGLLADMGYSRALIGGSMLLMAANALLFSCFYEVGVSIFMINQALVGCAFGVIRPSVWSLVVRITRASERTLAVAFIIAFYQIVHTIGGVIFTYIYEQVQSWKLGQHTVAVVGLVWFVPWVVYVHYTPFKSDKHCANQNPPTTAINRARTLTLAGLNKLKAIPWRRIVSWPFIGLLLATCGVSQSYYYYELNYYQIFILRLPSGLTKYSNAATNFAGVPSSLLAAFLADWVTNHKVISKSNAKRSLVFFGVFSSAILDTTSITLVYCRVVLFWILAFSHAFAESVAKPLLISSIIDFNPRHAGLLIGITTCARSLYYLLLKIVQRLTLTGQSKTFHLALSAFICVLIIPFLIFGPEDMQQNWIQSARREGDRRLQIHTEDQDDKQPQARTEDQN